MITEQMVDQAMAGDKVYFRTAQGLCMVLWLSGRALRINPQMEESCE